MKVKVPKKIIGLDLSLTSTGLVSYLLSDGSETIKTIKTNNKTTYMNRYDQVLTEIKSEVLNNDPLFLIEGYSFGSFSKSTAMSNLIELGGIIKFYLWQRGLEVISVPPTLLKKFITGKGNAKKEDIKLGIYKKYGKEFKTSDEADAYGLMAIGYSYVTGKSVNGKPLTAAELECFSKLIFT